MIQLISSIYCFIFSINDNNQKCCCNFSTTSNSYQKNCAPTANDLNEFIRINNSNNSSIKYNNKLIQYNNKLLKPNNRLIKYNIKLKKYNNRITKYNNEL